MSSTFQGTSGSAAARGGASADDLATDEQGYNTAMYGDEPTITVFLSGTRADLGPFHQAVAAALARAMPHVRVRMMESASPDGSRGDVWSRREATSAHLLVGLIGDYYGHIPEGQALSLTEQEFDSAGRADVDRLMFITHSGATPNQSAEALESAGRFQQRVSELFRVTVVSPKVYAEEVVKAVQEWEAETLRGATQLAEAYYAAFLRDIPYGHQTRLVGRDPVLAEIERSLASGSRVVVVHGPWGSGKSRVLLEMARRADVPVRFCRRGASLTRDRLGVTPVDPVILVLDDASGRSAEELPALVEFLLRCDPALKLVLSCRTADMRELNELLRNAGVPAGEVVAIPVGSLDSDRVHELVVEILGRDDRVAAVITDRSQGSTLAAVVAARLARRGGITLGELETSDEFEWDVLGHYTTSLIKQVPPDRKGRVQAAIGAVALVGPIRPADEEAMDTLSAFIGDNRAGLLGDLAFLEQSGFLIRAGGLLHLPVDSIREEEVLRTCITTTGVSTGEAQRAAKELSGGFRRNLLRNLAAAEQRGQAKGERAPLLDFLLPELTALYVASGGGERLGLLSDMEPVAAVRPDEMLRFANAAATIGLAPGSSEHEFRRVKLEWLQERLTRIIQIAMLEPRLVARGCDVLWAMAKAGPEVPPNNRDSPEKALREAGKRDGFRQPEWYEAFFAWCERHRAAADIPPARIARYIGGLLGKEYDDHWVRGRTFVLTTRLLNPSAVIPLMRRALVVLKSIADAESPDAVASAIDEIGGGVAEPRARGETPPELLALWEPFQLESIEVLGQIYRHHNSLVFGMVILSVIKWAGEYASQPAVRAAAAALASTISQRLEGTLEQAVAPTHMVRWPEGVDEHASHVKEIESVAQGLARSDSTESELLESIEAAASRLEEAKIPSSPHILVYHLAKARPGLLETLIQRLGNDPHGLLGWCIEPAVSAKLEVESSEVPAQLDRVVATGNETAMRSIASGFRSERWGLIPSPDQRRILVACLSSTATGVRQIASETLGIGRGIDPLVRADLLMSLEPGGNETTQETWSMAVYHGYESLSAEARRRLPKKLGRLERFDYWARALLARLSREEPGFVVDMLLERLDGFAVTGPLAAAKAAPLHGDDAPAMWAGLPRGERERALRGIGERLVADDATVREAGESLFLQVAAGEPALVKELRVEWASDGSLSGLLKAATTFAHDDEIALVESEDTVVAILRGASALGPEAFDSVRQRLRAGGGTRAMWVDPSGPSEDERLLVERADGLAVKYGEGTEVGRFYKDLADRTRALIAHRTRHMEERDLDD